MNDMFFYTLGIKNIIAHKKRTVITLLLTTLTTTLMVFSSAFMDGSHDTMIKSAVEIYPGYIQVTQKDFRTTPGFDNLIFNADNVKKELQQIEGIAEFGLRFESSVLFSSEQRAVAGLFCGIEPQQEAHLSRLKSSLKEGRYLLPDDSGSVYMGVELARKLGVAVGDTLSFIGTGADYSFAADNVTLIGTFQTGLFDFDASGAFVAKDYFDMIMAAENMATHVIILPQQPSTNEALAREIHKQLGAEYQSAPWQETMASLVQAMLVDSIFGYINLSIIFLVIFFVIMIYTLLAIFARVRELGVLRAIGTSPWQIFKLLLFESSLLSITGVVIGGALGAALAYYFSIHPMVFSGYEEQFKQYGLAASAMPTAFSPPTILRDMLIMFLLSLSSSLYPIIKLMRLHPIEAIHHV